MNEKTGNPNPLGSLRVLLVGMLLGLLWKIEFFQVADSVYHTFTIEHSFFPAWLRSAIVLRFAFVASVLTYGLSLFVIDSYKRRCLLGIGLFAATVLLLHQGSHNDMTFTTVWWCSVFAFWFSGRIGIDREADLMSKASFLSRVIVALVLLGGAAGKWTSEYWSGQVFYEIYFVERDFWVFNLLRDWFDKETLRAIATGYSRKVIVVESLGALIWLFPSRWAAVIGTVLFAGIALSSNFLLFSVLWPLIGLSLVGWGDANSESVLIRWIRHLRVKLVST